MKHTERFDKYIGMRINGADYKALEKIAGPFGQVSSVIRYIIKQFLQSKNAPGAITIDSQSQAKSS